ncbi:MAG: phytanoyl-CoA dioxygenase, partial [Rhodospirillaceae bacterium]|nr:phytanoyl-CoA dioxygenase [Rhodospirillaceae bacterium]
MTDAANLARTDYDEDGCKGPLRVLSQERAAEILASLDAVTQADVAGVKHPWFYKSYLLFTWMNELVRTPAVLDAVEQVIGPNQMVM